MTAQLTCNYPYLSMKDHVKKILNFKEGESLTYNYPSYFSEEFRLRLFYTGRSILLSYTLKEKWAYHIKYFEQKTSFEGRRYWFICPIKGCGHKVDKLYLKEELFACRKCHKLLYPSQNRSKYTLPMYKLERLEDKFKGKGRWGNPPPRPKGMHQKKYEQLSREYSDIYSEIMAKGEFNISTYNKLKSKVKTYS